MRRLIRAHVVLAGLIAVLLVVSGGGAAYAYWSTTGSGTGTATNATMQTVTVAAFAGETPTSTLIPGGPAADVILKVTNPNAFPVQVYSVVGTGAAITADAGHPGCTTTGVTFTAPAAPISPTVTVAQNSTLLVDLTGAASMDTTSMSACQGATFHIPVTLTVHK